jgi:hypothetical protein
MPKTITIAGLFSGDEGMIVVTEWISAHAARHRLRVREFLLDDALVLETEECLKEIAQVIEKRAVGAWEELPEDMMGLPMTDLVDGLMQAWEAAQAAASDEWRAEIERR